MINKVDLGSTDKFLAAIGNYYRVFQVVLRGAQVKTRTESQKLQGRFTDLQELPAQENLFSELQNSAYNFLHALDYDMSSKNNRPKPSKIMLFTVLNQQDSSFVSPKYEI